MARWWSHDVKDDTAGVRSSSLRGITRANEVVDVVEQAAGCGARDWAVRRGHGWVYAPAVDAGVHARLNRA